MKKSAAAVFLLTGLVFSAGAQDHKLEAPKIRDLIREQKIYAERPWKSIEVLMSGGVGNGGNHCDGRLRISRNLALAIIESVDLDLLNRELKDLERFYQEGEKSPARLLDSLGTSRIEALVQLWTAVLNLRFDVIEGSRPNRVENSPEKLDMKHTGGENVEVYEESCKNLSVASLSDMIQHEAIHSLSEKLKLGENENGYDDRFDPAIWEVVYSIRLSVDPEQRTAESLRTSSEAEAEKLNEMINELRQAAQAPASAEPGRSEEGSSQTHPNPSEGSYQDPYYNQYLMPGQIPWSKIFEPWDRLAATRSDFRERFAESIAGLTFRRGVIEVPVEPMVRQGRFIENTSSYAEGYIQALKAAIGPHTGLRVVSTGYISESATSGGGAQSTTKYVFIVIDPDAEAKVELIKANHFQSIEEEVSRVRKHVIELHRSDWKDSVELTREVHYYQRLLEDQPLTNRLIEQKLKEMMNGKEVGHFFFSLAPYGDFDQWKKELPDDRDERKKALETALAVARSRAAVLSSSLASGTPIEEVREQAAYLRDWILAIEREMKDQ